MCVRRSRCRRPGRPNGAIDLDGRFGLHPSLQPLKGRVGQRSAGDRRGDRFAGSDAIAFRRAGFHGVGHAWPVERGRLAESCASGRRPGHVAAPCDRDGCSASAERCAAGSLPWRSAICRQFQVRNQQAAGILESMYAATADAKLKASGKETFDAARMLESIARTPYTPANGAQYQGRVRPQPATGRAADQGRRRR